MKKPKSMHGEDCDCSMCMAKGGEAKEEKPMDMKMEASMPEDEDSEIHEGVGKELMEAIHSKDHKKLMSGLEAMVLHHMSKRE